MIYGLLYSFVFVLSRIPYGLAQSAGRLLGLFFSMIPIQRREVALRNILASFEGERDEETCRKILRGVYVHFGRMLFEVPHILRLDRDRLSRYVVFENEERFQAALDKGKGAFILTAHFGNWEFMSAAIQVRFGLNSAVVVRPMDFAPLDQLVTRMRSRFGTEVIPKQKAMRRIIGALREKKTLGILLDQNVDWYEGAFVPFLGRWACTNKGLALMALKTGAPVVPIFSVRQGDGLHRILFGHEIELVRTGDKAMDVEENTILFTRAIEEAVRKYPDQWFWFHRRWKTRNFCTLEQKTRDRHETHENHE
jgi:Kdo2-lipid IVA lauroyltransferase/acyltransferase